MPGDLARCDAVAADGGHSAAAKQSNKPNSGPKNNVRVSHLGAKASSAEEAIFCATVAKDWAPSGPSPEACTWAAGTLSR